MIMRKMNVIFLSLVYFIIMGNVCGFAFDTGSVSSAPNELTFSLGVNPALGIPIAGSEEFYDLAFSGDIRGELGFFQKPLVFASTLIDYEYSSILAENSLSLFAVVIGAGAYLDIAPGIGVKLSASGGYFMGMFNSGDARSSWNPVGSASIGLYYAITPALTFGVNGAYKNYIGLKQGIDVSIGLTYYLAGSEVRASILQSNQNTRPELLKGLRAPGPGKGVSIESASYDQVFPVFYKYYDDHQIGKIVLKNVGSENITDLNVSFFIKQYMDAPKECIATQSLSPGERKEIELFALFTDSVLRITENTKVASEIMLEYRIGGEAYGETKIATIRINDRNAMTWDDDRKAAAFITFKDPTVLTFAKNVSGIVRDKGNKALNQNLLSAIGIFKALDVYGISYVVDPRTPYIEFSKNRSQIDFLQFPRQTFTYKAGDCDDLSILFCSLLEAVGIETAFITVPGHIFIAFSTDIDETDATRHFTNTQDLIFRNGKVWIPVEVTERENGFITAWAEGAKEWREYSRKKDAGFFDVHDSWNLYEPVGLPSDGSAITIPPEPEISSAFLQEVVKFIGREITPKISKLEDAVKKDSANVSKRNNLGILYAQYGLLDKAEEQFTIILAKKEFGPALINFGNIHYMKTNYVKAIEYYERAVKLEPGNSKALLNIARSYYRLEKYDRANESYARLKKVDPKLAARYASLYENTGGQARAKDINDNKGEILWAE
jgi:tetratricopeptide (TPR) repeat protein